MRTRRHLPLEFLLADACEIAVNEPFDFVIPLDLLTDLWDVQVAARRLQFVQVGTACVVTESKRCEH